MLLLLDWSVVSLSLHLLLLLINLNLNFEDVVFEVALLFGAVGEYHLSIAVLDAFDPFALIAASICPLHFSVAVALILAVLPFILIS